MMKFALFALVFCALGLRAEEVIPVLAETPTEVVQAAEPTPSPVPTPDLSMKGRKGLSLVYTGVPALAWTQWTSESRAQRYGFGGSFTYDPTDPFPQEERSYYDGRIQLFWGLRQTVARLGKLGYIFTQPGLETNYQLMWLRTEFPGAGGVMVYRDQPRHIWDLKVNWRTGAEVFWPGTRDLSFESSVGAFLGYQGSYWSSSDVTNSSAYPPGPPIHSYSHRLALGMDMLRWDAALNFYYR